MSEAGMTSTLPRIPTSMTGLSKMMLFFEDTMQNDPKATNPDRQFAVALSEAMLEGLDRLLTANPTPEMIDTAMAALRQWAAMQRAIGYAEVVQPSFEIFGIYCERLAVLQATPSENPN